MTRQEQIKQAATAKSRGETPYYYEAFVEGAEWADEHPHWISVEEKRPPCKEDVLLWSSGFDVALKGFRNNEDLYYVYDTDAYWDNITHWMPMPALPMEIRGNQGKISPNHIIGTEEHIKVALDVLDKKGGDQ